MKIEDDKKKGKASPQNNHTTAQPAGLTLEQYAADKVLPISDLQEYGLSNAAFAGRPAVRIPYLGADGDERAVRFRIALAGEHSRWKSGSKACLYGLNRVDDACAAGHVDSGQRRVRCSHALAPRLPRYRIAGCRPLARRSRCQVF